MEETRPDLIIAIDFGMTCTGVAYANPSIGADTIRWIQRWPGRMQANENKVPTILVYPNDQPNPSSWGFLSETMTEVTAVDKEFREWFKTFLDEGRLSQAQRDAKDPADVPKSIEEVEKLFCDYFKFLYQHIRSKLQNEIAARWEDARIDFIFSVPTTWAPNPTVERFRKIIERAGFGQYPSHIASIGLTEAEAAAVHMSRESPAIFLERDILVVCDVGGGTTDLSALRVTDTGSGSLSLEQLDVVFGANLGSAQIDRGFENAALQRLEFANRSLPMGIEVEDAAWEMMKSKEYQNAKCDYGAEDDTPMFSVAVPKLSRTYTNESAGIINGELRFQRDDLKILFDAQIDRLFGLIDKQLTRINQKFPQEQVAHLVLSGGLGNSAYLQQRLRERYAFGRAPFPNALRLQVGVAPDPQLVVCKGIVADRIQKMKSGKSVLGWRCCRSSYGTICKVLYNPQNPMHHNKATERDPMDGQLYIANVIDWFIKQGDPVSIDYPIVRSFRQKVTPGNPKRVFPTAVIESHLDKTLLPFVMDHNCRTLCSVQSDFSTVELAKFKLKNRHFWNRGQKYHRVDYVVKVVLGPADIRFELWWNGQKLSRDAPIKVEWHAAPAPDPSTLPPAPDINPMAQPHFGLPTAQSWGGVPSQNGYVPASPPMAMSPAPHMSTGYLPASVNSGYANGYASPNPGYASPGANYVQPGGNYQRYSNGAY